MTRSTTSKSTSEEGFSLLELLVVIVVLGILAAVVVFSLGGVAASAAVSSCKADVNAVENAVQAYEVQNQGAIPTASSLTSGANSELQSFPSSSYYTITLVNGVVMVAAPSTASAVAATVVNSCSGAGTTVAAAAASPGPTTTTTVSPTTTTTTVSVSNGVTVTPGTSSFGSNFDYGGQETLVITNASSITAMTVTINAAASSGMSYNSTFNTFPGGVVTFNESSPGGAVQATWTDTNQMVSANYDGELALQLGGTGSAHLTSGDTWSVTTTSGATTSTLTGHF